MSRQPKVSDGKKLGRPWRADAKILFLCVCSWVLSGSQAFAQSNFYEGKTITYIVGLLAGDSTDLWSRAVSRNMAKYIPGNPSIVVQNMPGAGGLIAANYLYGVARPDGLTLGAVSAGHYFHQLAGRKEAQFDWRKFTWIGSSARHEYLVIMRADSPYKSIDDIRSASVPPKCSATAPGSASHITLKLLEEGLGLRLQIVTGYKGGSEQDLAIERGEVQCRAVTTAAFLGREPFQTWQKSGFIRVLLQTPRRRNPRLPEVPTVYELMERVRPAESNRRVALVLLGTDNFGNFPTVATPGIPADRVKILRAAYAKALKDPDLLEEAKKRRWEVDYIEPEELERLAKEVIEQPPEIVTRIKELLESK
ncbi:MAG TPA: tripartite tricarboxylate transporter substrate-binding protein [Candidatus Acidoferrales bacterium]|nr:tripartite tricarboxylate transporter substrate-binding protein [Candidatus Acidoferrales bacterium]